MRKTKSVIEDPTVLDTMGSYVRLVQTNFNPAPYCVELSPASFDYDGSIKHDDEWGTMDHGPGSKESAFSTYVEAAAFIRLLRTFRDHLDPAGEVADVSVGESSVCTTDCGFTVVIVQLEVSIAPERDEQGLCTRNGRTEFIQRREVLRMDKGNDYYRLYNSEQAQNHYRPTQL